MCLYVGYHQGWNKTIRCASLPGVYECSLNTLFDYFVLSFLVCFCKNSFAVSCRLSLTVYLTHISASGQLKHLSKSSSLHSFLFKFYFNNPGVFLFYCFSRLHTKKYSSWVAPLCHRIHTPPPPLTQALESSSMEGNLSADSRAKCAVLACYCNFDIDIFLDSFVISSWH